MWRGRCFLSCRWEWRTRFISAPSRKSGPDALPRLTVCRTFWLVRVCSNTYVQQCLGNEHDGICYYLSLLLHLIRTFRCDMMLFAAHVHTFYCLKRKKKFFNFKLLHNKSARSWKVLRKRLNVFQVLVHRSKDTNKQNSIFFSCVKDLGSQIVEFSSGFCL